jgi:FkbM family methyltransferase
MNFKEEMRYDYNLNRDSLVFDVGAYKGEFGFKIIEKYGCKVISFEPVFDVEETWLYGNFAPVYRFGLSDITRYEKIYINGDRTSLYGKGKFQEIQLVCFWDWFRTTNFTVVDLIKINIEGEEYRLLRHMINTGMISMFRNIQIQYHDFMPDAAKLRADISEDLSKTHIRKWCYPFIWESWECRQ